MKLEDFLFLIEDEDARIELEIDDKEDYQYHNFWLSDFRLNKDIVEHYRDREVSSFSFEPEKETKADIRIYIKSQEKEDKIFTPEVCKRMFENIPTVSMKIFSWWNINKRK